MSKRLLAGLFALTLVSNTVFAAETPPAQRPASSTPSPQPATVFPDTPCTVIGGIKGRVFLAPFANAKETLPVSATIVVKDGRGVVFVRTQTDKDGNFTADVPPATYVVEVTPKATWLAPATARITATEKYTNMDVFYKK